MQVDSEYVRLRGAAELWLACRLVVIQHNSVDCRAPPDDGWASETLLMEAQAEERMVDERIMGDASE
jgi:hypothetical protein